jgi:PIN domain nuclease of toxin-antitoxin system
MAGVTHVLDTSALLAHAFQEPGWERVREILDDDTAVLGLPAPGIPSHLLRQEVLPPKT